jgi:circadian clock protein KaiB
MRKSADLASESSAMEVVVTAHAPARYVLRLYTIGSTTHSARAISNIRKICEKYLEGRYDLEIVDISQHPMQAASEQIIAAPTLIKKLPLPLRRFIGDMSHTDRILLGLDLCHLTDQLPSMNNS